jgi:hypothetical protein
LGVFYDQNRCDLDSDLPNWRSDMEGEDLMIMLSILAVLAGVVNIWLAMLKTTLEARVNDLLMVIVLDALLLIAYKIWVGDPLFGLFLSVKYLFFCFINFDKALRRGLG